MQLTYKQHIVDYTTTSQKTLHIMAEPQPCNMTNQTPVPKSMTSSTQITALTRAFGIEIDLPKDEIETSFK